MLLNEIVWVFGPSAIGKKTLIRDFAYGDDKRLLQYFGIDKCVVIPFTPRIKGYDRYIYLKSIFDMSLSDDISKITMNHIYLIHGQPMDVIDGNIDRLYDIYPNRFNTYLFLEVSEDDYNIRVGLRNKFRNAINCRYIDEGGYHEAYRYYKSEYIPYINKYFKNMGIISS